MALIMMADISDPYHGRCGALIGIASPDGTTLKDQPCLWHHSLASVATLRQELIMFGWRKPDVTLPRANPSRNPASYLIRNVRDLTLPPCEL